MSKIVPIRPTRLFRALDKLADDTDQLIERRAELRTLENVVWQQTDALAKGQKIDQLADKQAAALSDDDAELLARCAEVLALLDPAENYEGNDKKGGDLRRGVIKIRLASVIGAFPNGSPGDPDVYVGMLLEHVCAVEGLSLPALDAACRNLVATQKFLPTVSEVMEAVSRQQARWDRRLLAISNIADQSRRLVAQIEALEPEAKAAAQARAEQEQAAAKARAVEQARRAYTDAEDAYCDARRELAEKQEEAEQALERLLECQSELARAELIARNNSDDANGDQ